VDVGIQVIDLPGSLKHLQSPSGISPPQQLAGLGQKLFHSLFRGHSTTPANCGPGGRNERFQHRRGEELKTGVS